MEVHFGVIRDKEGIYSALRNSHAMNRQLAICYRHEGKLLVTISTVGKIVGKKEGVRIVLKSSGEDDEEVITIPLNEIQSIYPIRDFTP